MAEIRIALFRKGKEQTGLAMARRGMEPLHIA